MPRPKKEKQDSNEAIINLQQDREEFMTAFEKPTQIYRFLHARHLFSPTFLHRSTAYMMSRCSRNNKRRSIFKVDDMLETVKLSSRHLNGKAAKIYDELKLEIIGFFTDPGVDSDNNSSLKRMNNVELTVSVHSTSQCRRKSGQNVESEDIVGSTCVAVNPRTVNYHSVISLSMSDIQQHDDNSTNKNHTLVFRLFESRDSCSDSSDYSDEESSGDSDGEDNSGRKRRKVEEDHAAISLHNLTSGPRKRKTLADDNSERGNSVQRETTPRNRSSRKCHDSKPGAGVCYEAELALFNNDNDSCLLDGVYELAMSRQATESGKNKKNSSWEALDGGRDIQILSSMNSTANLKMKLTWIDTKNSNADCENGRKSVEKGEGSLEPEPKRLRRKNSVVTSYSEGTELVTPDVESEKNNNINLLPYQRVDYKKSLKKNSPTSKIFYQFIYSTETHQQTEAREDCLCPWCLLNCINLYGIFKHLRYCHPRFNFVFSIQSQGVVVEVSVNECYDGSYSGNPQFIFAQPGMVFNRRGPVHRIPATDVLVYKSQKAKLSLQMDLNEMLEKEDNVESSAAQYTDGHHRLYFHSRTAVPVRPCEFDNDSEDETDPDWLRSHIRHMLDEFTDVNEGEKPIMKMWNLYVVKHSCISDSQISVTCKSFISLHAQLIALHSLRRNLLLHFVTLVDFGVLKASMLITLMEYYDKIVKDLSLPCKSTSDVDFKVDKMEIGNESAEKNPQPIQSCKIWDVTDMDTNLQLLQNMIDAGETNEV